MTKLPPTLFLAAMLAFGPPAHAAADGPSPEPPAGHAGGRHDMMMHHMQMMREHGKMGHKSYADVVLQQANELKLSDEQIGKITRIQQAAQQKIDALGPKLHETIKATHEVFLNPAADEAAIRAAAKEHTTAFEQLLETGLKTRNEINAVLSPEQLRQLQAKKTTP